MSTRWAAGKNCPQMRRRPWWRVIDSPDLSGSVAGEGLKPRPLEDAARPKPRPPRAEGTFDPLYEKSKTVHNKRIDGPFRRFKWFVMVVTLTIYYVTPWLRWDRGPYAPDQDRKSTRLNSSH